MRSFLRTAALLLACFDSVHAFLPIGGQVQPMGLSDAEEAELADPSVSLVGNGTFEQPIDHTNSSKGTFSTSYWYNATNWQGPGSPIIVFTPGEAAAAAYTGYLTERTLTGMIAAALGGAVVLIEHRYWGDSSPCENQTTTCLQDLTLQQAVDDFVRFAQVGPVPFDTTNSSNADQAPWVWVGGSYSGALAAWVEKLSPGTYWAYHSTSGPVEAIYDYWQYFYPIQQGMPKNCSIDYEAIVDYVDSVFINGTEDDKLALKAQFNLEDLAHDDDAAVAISAPIWAWQSIQFYSGYSSFYQMCDAIEGVIPNKTGNYSDGGVGLDKALPNFAAWYTTNYLPGCLREDEACDGYGYDDWSGDDNVQCFDTYNTSMEVFHDWTPDNGFDRPWIWMTCNEPLFYWQTGAPEGIPTVMTRLATPEYYQRQCELWFPTEGPNTFGSNRGLTAESTNSRTDGWFNTNTTRLLYVNGEYDPWRSASVASDFRPGGPFNGTEDVPAILMEGSRHCNDLLLSNNIHPSVAATQDAAISQFKEWVGEFTKTG
ncbi:serine carboxypeptidase S28 [Seiridium cupressi]